MGDNQATSRVIGASNVLETVYQGRQRAYRYVKMASDAGELEYISSGTEYWKLAS
jgi:hypothetical protein